MDEQAIENKLVTPEMLQGLPQPVQHYLACTGVVGKPWILTAQLIQAGRFRMGPERPWMPIKAVQTFTTTPPGFVWKATGQVAGLPLVKGRDCYQDGHGHMLGKLAGLYTIFNARGKEMDQSSLTRYLSEMMWFPTAFLGDNISWQGIDDHSTQVTLTDGGKSVSARMEFDDQGRPTLFKALRYYEEKGQYSLVPWSNLIDRYQAFGGLNVPTHGQVMWNMASDDFTYFDWDVSQIEYNVA